MSRTRNSLTGTFLISMILLAFISILIFAYFWLSHEYQRFNQESAALKNDYIESRKFVLKNEVDKAIDHIRYEYSFTENRLKAEIRARVYEAHSIAMNIYRVNKEQYDDLAIQKMIKDALRPIRFRQERGYYFATHLNGVEELFADRPEMEGKNLLDLQDTQGKYVIRDMIQIAKQHEEGFYQYVWTKPNANGKNFPKIAFIKFFEPYNWFIGTGEYLDDIRQDIQIEALERLASIRFEETGYLFGSTYNGDPLFTNGSVTRGTKSVWELTDPNGVKIIQEQRRLADHPAGGFLFYSWKKLDVPDPSPKISFTRGFPEWEWMIGAGVYIDEIENVIEKEKALLMERIRSHISKIIALLVALLACIYLTAKYISNRIRKGFQIFSEFFQVAATEHVEINPDQLYYSELKDMALSANRMIKDWEKAEGDLNRTRNYLNNILNSTPSALIGIDPKSSITAFNSAAEKLSGILADQAKGRMITDVFPDYSEFFGDIKSVLLERKTMTREKIPIHHPNETRYYSISIYPIIADDIEDAVLRIDDVTESIRFEQMIIQAEKMMSVGGLAAGMAHEINNPLGAILQSAQNILRRISPELEANEKIAQELGTNLETIRSYIEKRDIVKFIEGIRLSGEKASKIVANMLGFSRRSESKMAPIHLAELLNKTIELAANDYDLKKKYDFRKIEIIREFTSDLPEVVCTETEIEQVILNLLRNSAQAIMDRKEDSQPPRITLRLIKEPDMARIEVEDNGPGIDETTAKRIFEPFFTTKNVGDGIGLGLSVSYFIITRNHKGTMRVKSAPGQGSTFIIQIPLHRL